MTRLILLACAIGGGCAGLAGAIEVAAEYGRANASLNAGYGYTGILIAFLARFNPLRSCRWRSCSADWARPATAAAADGPARRNDPGAARPDLRLDPDERHAVWTLPLVPAAWRCLMEAIGTVLLAMLAGSLRVSTPFLFVSLGECLTEKSGRINLGNEGVLVLGAMVAYALSYETAAPGPELPRRRSPACCSGPARRDLFIREGERRGDGHRHHAGKHRHRVLFGKPYVQPSATLLPDSSASGRTIRRFATRYRCARCSARYRCRDRTEWGLTPPASDCVMSSTIRTSRQIRAHPRSSS